METNEDNLTVMMYSVNRGLLQHLRAKYLKHGLKRRDSRKHLIYYHILDSLMQQE